MNVPVILLFVVVIILLAPMKAVRASGDTGTPPRPSTDSSRDRLAELSQRFQRPDEVGLCGQYVG